MSASTTAPAPTTSRSSLRGPRLEGQLLLILVIMWVAFALLSPDVFPTSGTAENLARQGGILLVVAIGQMLVLVVGGFDISVGANMGFTATVAALMVDDVGLVLAVVIALAGGAGAGLVNGLVVSKLRVNPFIATLGMLTLL